MLALQTNLKRVECVAFHPAGGLVAAGGRGVELWDVRAMQRVWEIGWEFNPVKRIAFSKDGRILHALIPDHQLLMFDTDSGSAFKDQPFTSPRFLAVSASDGRAVTGGHRLASWFPGVWNWSWVTELDVTEFQEAAFVPGGDTFLTHEVGGSGQRFVLRDSTSGNVSRSARCPFHNLDALAFSPDGTLLVARLKNELLVWPVAYMHRPPRRIPSDSAKAFTDFAFHPDGRHLATASNDRRVKAFDTDTWAVIRAFEWNAGRMRSIAFAPDGLTAAAGGEQGQLVLFDVDL